MVAHALRDLRDEVRELRKAVAIGGRVAGSVDALTLRVESLAKDLAPIVRAETDQRRERTAWMAAIRGQPLVWALLLIVVVASAALIMRGDALVALMVASGHLPPATIVAAP
jgi:hypothetical protein